jgi:FkbM family methyltransferase
MMRFYSPFVGADDLCFDVGAHTGNRTKIFAALGAVTVAVEPNPECMAEIERFYGRNPRVHLCPEALGSTVGEAVLKVSNASTLSSLSPEWIQAVRRSGRFAHCTWDREIVVPVTTLDRLIERFGVPTFVKIDVERFEFEVLKGLSRPVPALSMEFTPEYLDQTEAGIRRLSGLAHTEFNYTLMENMRWMSPRWMSAEEIIAALRPFRDDRTVFGDVYARVPGARTSPSGRERRNSGRSKGMSPTADGGTADAVTREVRGRIRAFLQTPAPPAPATVGTVEGLDNAVERLIAKGIAAYAPELDGIRWWARLRNEPAFFPQTGMYDWAEAQILYLLIRQVRPECVVEISPNYGYSTGFILMAMNRNGHGTLYSYDLDAKFHAHALHNYERVGISAVRQRFVAGDVRNSVGRNLPDRVDLLFMDSDHSYDFARWYIAHLYPRVGDGSLIHAHDVLPYGVQPHQGERGEGRAIWEFLRESQISGSDYLYVSELVRRQPVGPEILKRIERYPFPGETIGTNNVEQNASFWMIKRMRGKWLSPNG